MNDRINELDDKINRLNSKMDTLNDRMDMLDDRVDTINNQIDNADNKMSTLDERIDIIDNQTKIADNKTPTSNRKKSPVNSILIETIEEVNDLLKTTSKTVNEYHEMYISDKLNEKQTIQLRKLEIRVKELQDKLKTL